MTKHQGAAVRRASQPFRLAGRQRKLLDEIGALLELAPAIDVAVACTQKRTAGRCLRQTAGVQPTTELPDPYRRHQVCLSR